MRGENRISIKGYLVSVLMALIATLALGLLYLRTDKLTGEWWKLILVAVITLCCGLVLSRHKLTNR